MNTLYLLVNFGGPRNRAEVEPFLKALLCDKDVIRTCLPQMLHNVFFSRIAKKRAEKIAEDYALIGGKSPIFDDTEAIGAALRSSLKSAVLTFHRYIPATHSAFYKSITEGSFDEIRVLPLFPQFSFATTGSIARWFSKNLPSSVVNKMRWVKSYFNHPSYIAACIETLKSFLAKEKLKEEECLLFFFRSWIAQRFYRERGSLPARMSNHL